MRGIIRKAVGVLFYLAYYYFCLLVLAPTIFNDLLLVSIILLDMLIFSVDALISPVEERGEVDRPTAIIALLFLLHPVVVTVFFYENMFLIVGVLVALNSTLISYLGVVLYILAAIILVTSRLKLGRFSTGKLAIQEQHELLTDGIYTYIRHPLYSGVLLGKLGMGLVFRSYFATFLILIVYFLVFRNRMEIEERILADEFGGAYTSYIERTKRIIPYIY